VDPDLRGSGSGRLITIRNKDTWRDILWGRVPGRTGDTVGKSREMSQKGSIVVDTPLHTCGAEWQTNVHDVLTDKILTDNF
jgi:hypothetical protein